jgi:hypothetical protein
VPFLDAVTLGWDFNVEPLRVSVCWQTQSNTDALDQWSASQEQLEVAASRWSGEEPIFEPDSHYLLEVITRSVLTKDGDDVDRIESEHPCSSRPGGPPGIVLDRLDEPPAPAPNSSLRFPHGGVLADLAPYVRWSIPGRGAVPVFRAYDVGCESDASHVQQR